jgi:thiol:disulfide interchange protein/DsbC/DsbD-like thiol-disulfide interchange protein
MRFWVLFLIALTNLTTDCLAAARTQVDLVNLTPEIEPKKKILIGVRFRCDPGFHIYWKVPGDAGQPPTITWREKAGSSISDFLFPGPTLYNQKGIISFIHSEESLFLLEVTPPAEAKGVLNLKAKVEWLECNEAGCYPQEKEVALSLKIGEKNEALSFDSRKYPDLQPVLSAEIIDSTNQSDSQNLVVSPPAPINPEERRTYSSIWFPERNFITASAVDQQSQQESNKVFSLNDAPEKLEAGPLSFITQSSDGTFVRIVVKKTTIAAASASTEKPKESHSLTWQPWSLESQNRALNDGKIVYIDFTARWCATCQVNKRVYTQEDVQNALLTQSVVLLKADWTKKDAAIAAELKKYGRQGIPLNVFLKKDQNPVILSEVLTGSEVLQGLEAITTQKPHLLPTTNHSFFFWLSLAFLGGAILNLMPCVFPMIGIKVLSIAQQSRAEPSTVILLGLSYTAGVVVSFLGLAAIILALKAGGSSIGWGFQMQSPGFVLGTSILMVTLGLSLLGLFEIGTSLAGKAGQVDQSQSFGGSFLSGVLATAVATPCTAPGLGAALGFALDENRSGSETFILFSVIGLGLASPYLLFSLFPQLARFLPAPGQWMIHLKRILALPLFAYAVYLLWVLNGLSEKSLNLTQVSVGFIFITSACWIWGRWTAPHYSTLTRWIAATFSVTIFVTSVYFLFARLT